MRTHVIAAAGIVGALGFGFSASAFDVHRHAFMVKSALDDLLQGNSMSATIAGVIYPDVSGCALDGYCDGWKRALRELCRTGDFGDALSEAARITLRERLHLESDQPRPAARAIQALAPDHFDDDSIENARDRAEARLGRARGILQRLAPTLDSAQERRDFVGAMLVFGTVLHATQDFYAHSNFMECHTRDANVDLGTLQLWNGDRAVQACREATTDAHDPPRRLTGLVSGVYYGANAQDEAGSFVAGSNRTHHADINKDNPDPAAPQGARRLRASGDPRDLYAAVSGQIGGNRAYDDAYTQLGLAVRHTRQAFLALVDGTPLFGSRAIAASDGAIDAIRLTARSTDNPIRQLLRGAANDSEILASLTAVLGTSGLAGCALGPDAAQTLLNWFE